MTKQTGKSDVFVCGLSAEETYEIASEAAKVGLYGIANPSPGQVFFPDFENTEIAQDLAKMLCQAGYRAQTIRHE